MSYRWAVIIGLFSAVSSAALFVSFSLGVMLPEMKKDLGLSPTQAAALGSVNWVATIFLGLPIAVWVSRFNPRLSIFAAALLMSMFAFLLGWAPSYSWLLTFRFLFMLCFVSRQANMAMLIQRWFAREEVPTVQAVVSVINNVAQIGAMALVPWLMIWLAGWRNTFYALGIALLLAAMVWVIFTRDRPLASPATPAAHREGTPISAVLRYKVVWLFSGAAFFCMIGWAAFLVFWPTFLTEDRGLSLRMAGLFTAGIPAGSIVGASTSRWIRNRLMARKQQLFIGGVTCTVSSLIMALSPVPALMPLGAFGLGWSCMQYMPTLMSLPYELPGVRPREVAVLGSLILAIFTVGGVVGPLLAGVVQEATGSLQTGLVVASLGHLGMFTVAFASEVDLPPLPRLQTRLEKSAA